MPHEVLTLKPDAVTIETSELLPWEARQGSMVEGGRRASEANLKASIPVDLQPLTSRLVFLKLVRWRPATC